MNIELIIVTEDELELIRGWRNSPEISMHMYTDKHIEQADQIAWYQAISADPSSEYWIITYDGRKIGLASISEINTNLSSCYWAFYIGENSIRGGGIGAKVEYAVIEHVFNEKKLNKLRCEVLVTNDRVIRMHERFGFRREALYREHVQKSGKWVDVVGLALLKSEWVIYQEAMKNKIYR